MEFEPLLNIHTYIHRGLLCSWQNATSYNRIQIHAVKIAKIGKMLIHICKQESFGKSSGNRV